MFDQNIRVCGTRLNGLILEMINQLPLSLSSAESSTSEQ